jgi:hypothetical protein
MIFLLQNQRTRGQDIFISNQQKHHVFLVIFYVFSTTKSEKKRAEQVLPRGGGVGIAYK